MVLIAQQILVHHSHTQALHMKETVEHVSIPLKLIGQVGFEEREVALTARTAPLLRNSSILTASFSHQIYHRFMLPSFHPLWPTLQKKEMTAIGGHIKSQTNRNCVSRVSPSHHDISGELRMMTLYYPPNVKYFVCIQSSCRVLCYILFPRSRHPLLSHHPLGSFNATHRYYLRTVVKAGTTAVTTYAVVVKMIFLALIVTYQEPGTKHLENESIGDGTRRKFARYTRTSHALAGDGQSGIACGPKSRQATSRGGHRVFFTVVG